MGERVRDCEAVWDALEAWRERTSGDVAIESVGAGWLCRLQAPRCGVAPALCHGADATTAVEGALSVYVLREHQARGGAEKTEVAARSTAVRPTAVRRSAPYPAPPADSHVAERAGTPQERERAAAEHSIVGKSR